MPPSNPRKNERKHARKKRKLEERNRQNSYTQITDWNGDLPVIVVEKPAPKVRISNRCMVKRSHIIVMAILAVLCIACIALTLAFGLPNLNSERLRSARPFLEKAPAPSSSPLRRFQHAAIAADADECAEIGRQMLRRNGTAWDAAIAALVCVGVVNMQSAGIGGGFLATMYDRQTRAVSTLIARETAPAAATRDMFNHDPLLARDGWLSAGVPGEVAGYWAAHQKYGKLPWRDLFQPTIAMCRDGYRMNKHQSKNLKKYQDDIKKDKTLRKILINGSTEEPLKEGDLVRRPELADTLQAIADGGAPALYGGQIGKLLAEDIQKNGGIITLQDLKDYKIRWEEPSSTTLLDGSSVHSTPPPGSGPLLTFIFNILDGYNYGQRPPTTKEEMDLMYHRIAEAFKFAYARRTELADPQFVDVSQLLQNLTSPKYADAVRSEIRDDRTFNDPSHYGVELAPFGDHGTAHVSVIDQYGNAVSATSTVNLYFGARVMSAQTGILLNDEMDDFSIPGTPNFFGLPPSPANFIKPGKMMMSSMCPAIFLDASGDLRLVTGGAGGSRITSGIVMSSVRHLYLREDVKKANDFPRFHHQLIPMTLSYDEGFPLTTLAYLSGQGHNVEPGKYAVIPALSVVDGYIEGNMDYRKGAGDVMGF